jgi:hypothetical protein
MKHRRYLNTGRLALVSLLAVTAAPRTAAAANPCPTYPNDRVYDPSGTLLNTCCTTSMGRWPGFLGPIRAANYLGCKQRTDFNIVVLPDTQYYSKYVHARYFEQAQWIWDHADSAADHLNVKQVIHVGDIVNNSDDPMQWEIAEAAHSLLDMGGIPYTVVPGNHDMTDDYIIPDNTNETPAFYAVDRGAANYDSEKSTTWKWKYYYTNQTKRYSEYHEWFGNLHQSMTPWLDSCPNDECIENNYQTFDVATAAPTTTTFLVVNLGFAPSKDALCWANDVIDDHPSAKAIVVTHAYQSNTYDPQTNTYGNGPTRSASDDVGARLIGASGEEIWDELIRRNSSIFLVLCGHRSGTDVEREHVTQSSLGMDYWVTQVLTDFQGEKDPWAHEDGYITKSDTGTGAGWLRLLKVQPNRTDLSNSTIVTTIQSTARYVNDDTPYGYKSLSLVDEYPADPANNTQTWSDVDLDPAHVNTPDRNSRRFGDRLVNSRAYDSIHGGPQRNPSIATRSDGTVVVWEDDDDGDGNSQILMRGFSGDGCQSFPESRVNQDTNGNHVNPKVAAVGSEYVVVWQSIVNGDSNILVAGFAADGTRLFPDQVVNQVTVGTQSNPSVAINSSGNFVVVWEDHSGRDANIVGRAFDTGIRTPNDPSDDGRPLTSQFDVNTAVNDQTRPTVAIDDSSRFATVWEDWGASGQNPEGVKARFLYISEQSHVHTWMSTRYIRSPSSGRYVGEPSIAMNAAGRFVTAWKETKVTNDTEWEVHFTGNNSDGTSLIAERTMSTSTTAAQPSVAMGRGTGEDFILAWRELHDGWCHQQSNTDHPLIDQNLRGFDIRAIQYHSNGDVSLSYDPVNKDTCEEQESPAVAIYGNKPVVVWQDYLNGEFYDWDIVMRGMDEQWQ